MARRKSTVSARTGVSPVYLHLRDQSLAAIAECDDPRRMEQHRQLVAEGIARPLDDLLRFHRGRVEACERQVPITVSRFELSRWFKYSPKECGLSHSTRTEQAPRTGPTMPRRTRPRVAALPSSEPAWATGAHLQRGGYDGLDPSGRYLVCADGNPVEENRSR